MKNSFKMDKKTIMLKHLYLLIFILSPLNYNAQDFSDSWKGFFSYNNIKATSQKENKIYVAAENSIFTLDCETNEITEITTVNGLSGDNISTILYNEAYELLVVGYENGLIEIILDNDDDIITIVDIVNESTILAGNKRINHFNVFNNALYISTNYGISVFDLEKLEFGDSYFIGNNGEQITVNQTEVAGDYIYAVCGTGNGIKKAKITSNLINFQNWETIRLGNFIAIEFYSDTLYVVGSDRIIYTVINDILTPLFTYPTVPRNIKESNNNLVVTTSNNIYIYNSSFQLISQASTNSEINDVFTTATVCLNDLYIGTRSSGLLKTSLLNPVAFEKVPISGPLLNSHFSVEFSNNHLWSAFGGYSISYGWSGGNAFTGLSHYHNEEWSNITYDSISSNIANPRFLSDATVNPLNPNQVYVSSFYSGLIEFNDEKPNLLFNKDNSTITPFVANFHLTILSEYDSKGVLWVLNGRVNKPLNKFENGRWTSYDFGDEIPNPQNSNGLSSLVFGEDGTKWIGDFENGVVAFRENGTNVLVKNISSEEENMPTNRVTALAMDNRNQLWIGTRQGLRVLFNTSGFFNDNTVRVNEIIIEEDGIAKELLFEQFITDIKVDGSNNKWIATREAGLFYLSSDGQKTIFHFTKDNSPLPSNTINDISLDSANGIVYIATDKGLLSFNSGGSSTTQNLETTYIYPNPVRPSFNMVDEKIKIKGISENTNIKITDIEGNLVAEAQSKNNLRFNGFNLEIDGGTAFWNGKNFANNTVASGVYLVLLSDLDTFETSVLKLMVVR